MNKPYFLFLLIIIILIGSCLYITGCTNISDVPKISETKEILTPQPTVVSSAYVRPSNSPTVISKPDVVKLSFAGDVIFDSWVGSLIDSSGHEQIISGLNELFKKSDISMVNLETPISTRGIKEKDKQFTFRAKPEYVKVLQDAGINIVTLANNHILDFGHNALRDTLDILKNSNIYYAGAGENVDEASKPIYINKNNTRIAILASSHVIPFTTWTATPTSPGVAVTYDPARTLSEIETAKKNSDIVVVYVHWGEEMKKTPVPYQKNLARMYIDKGADIVIGSHPHVLQGLEFYKNGVICYSLGNFIFTNSKKDTAIVNIEVENRQISEVKIIPCEILNFKTRVISDDERQLEILKELENISYGVEIQKDGIVKGKRP